MAEHPNKILGKIQTIYSLNMVIHRVAIDLQWVNFRWWENGWRSGPQGSSPPVLLSDRLYFLT